MEGRGRENRLDRRGEIGRTRVPFPIGTRARGPGLDQNASTSERSRRLDVAKPIADPPALGEIDPEPFGSLLIEQGTRLSATARTVDLRQMGTMVVCVECRAILRQELVHAALGGQILVLAQKAASDSRLVGGDDGEDAGLVEALDRGGDPGQETYLRGISQVCDILDERPIAIEKDRAASSPPAHSSRA
jgi:hypothetical protein